MGGPLWKAKFWWREPNNWIKKKNRARRYSVFLHTVSEKNCEILDLKLHAIVEAWIADRANKVVLTHEEGRGDSGSTRGHPYITTVNAISLVLPTDIADVA